MKLSVCIPAYNRAALLPPLLDSILSQTFDDYEILICEDVSPERAAIAEVAGRYSDRHPGQIRYLENERNLGFDANLRRLIEMARGDYCLFMGNDDLLAPDALAIVASAIDRHPVVGVVMRSYASFDDDPDQINQVFRYFDAERLFSPGPESIVTVFRRSVVISGVTLHRAQSLALATDRLDGTLLYQIYLAARLCARMNAVFVPQIIALYRNGGIPDFGHAESERGKFVPRDRTIDSSLHFMHGMVQVAEFVQASEQLPVRDAIVEDISRYSYPVLSIQASRPLREFVGYALALRRMGFASSKLFYAYVLSLTLLGAPLSDRLIQVIKRWVGHTPSLGRLHKGQRV